MAAGLKFSGLPGDVTRLRASPPEEVLLRRFLAELGFPSVPGGKGGRRRRRSRGGEEGVEWRGGG